MELPRGLTPDGMGAAISRAASIGLGRGDAPPLLFLQHLTGTLDNWGPALADPLALRLTVLLFECRVGPVDASFTRQAAAFLASRAGIGGVQRLVLGKFTRREAEAGLGR